MISGRKISIGGLNCRGIGDKYKRCDVFNYIKSKLYDITALVDTHCQKDKENMWKTEWGNDAFFSPVASNARGITILIKNSFSYHIHDTKADLGNDALLLDMSIENMRITLAAIYGPNKDSPEFFTSLQEEIKSFKNSTVVICGDYNVVLNYDLDTYKYINKNNPKAQKA